MIRAAFAVAALRLLLMTLAWPLFNNVDEQHHVDMAVKLARGRLPAGLERYDPEAARLIARAETWEVFGTPTPDRPLPAWRAADGGRYEASRRAWWEVAPDIESTGPPVPYVILALWRRVGGLLGLDDVGSLYWLRLLNVPLFLVAMWAAIRFAAQAFPGEAALPASVAVLFAAAPQDLYYGVNADVPASLFGTLALLGLWRIRRRGFESAAAALATGSCVAVALLTKFSNVAVLVPLAYVVMARPSAARGRVRGRVLILLGAAALPVAAWVARNALVLGDWTGGLAKAGALGWTPKPLAAWLAHPLFTVPGALSFAGELAATAWRGEYFWHGARLAWPLLDGWFAVSTAACLLAPRFAGGAAPRQERTAARVCLGMLGVSVAFLAAVSVAFDFGPCNYPSRARPTLTSARLISAAWAPFLILYARGLGRIVGGGSRRRLGAALLLAAVLLGTELWMSREVFASSFNWFHGPWWR